MPFMLPPNMPKQPPFTFFWPPLMEKGSIDSHLHSSMDRAQPPKETTPTTTGESGWTRYFDDFFPSDNGESSGSCSIPVSDAVSCAEWRFSTCAKPSMEPAKSLERLSFKKRRRIPNLEDDSLEDTATSPVNSPKISNLKELDMDPCKKNNGINSFQEKKDDGCGDCSSLKTDERNESCYGDCNEMKKRGLCLVPLSMLVDFLE